MGARLFLALSAAVWLPYGLYCFVDPAFLGDAAEVAFTGPTGSTEIRAMYGGLQMGMGILCARGALRADWQETALRTTLVLVSGLFLSRAGGVLIDGSPSAYTAMGLFFEGASSAAAAYFQRTSR